MFIPQLPRIAVVCIGLSLGFGWISPGAVAQDQADHPTAAELYEQGMEAFDRGELEEARALLRRVDHMQLPREDRVRYFETLQEIDRLATGQAAEETQADAEAQTQPASAEAPTPAQLLTQADQAAAAGDTAGAMALYQQVLTAEAEASTKATAQARLAELRRRLDADLTRIRGLIDQIDEDLRAGRAEEASQKLAQVQSSGVQLGWFDQQRVNRQLAVLQEHGQAVADASEQSQAPAEEAQAAAPSPTQEQQAAAEEQSSNPDEAQVVLAAPPGAAVEGGAPQVSPSEDLLTRYRLLRAQQLFAEGQEAEISGQLDLAIRRYEQSLQLNPENNEAAQRLTAVRTQRNVQMAPQGVLEADIARRQLQIQQVEAEFGTAMDRARNHLRSENFPAALNEAARARSILDSQQQVLPSERYRQLRGQAEALSTQIVRAQEQAQIAAQRELEQQQARQEKDMRQRIQRETYTEVQRLLQRAMELRMDMQYEQALELVNQALVLDPTNVAAQAMKMGIEDSKILVEARDLYRKRDIAKAEISLQNIEATTPYTDLIIFPADWPQITYRRLVDAGEGGAEPEANRRVRLRMREPLPVNFQAVRLANVIDFLRSTTELNFFVNWPALQQAGVEPDTPITLQLTSVPADQVLRLVLQQVSTEFDPVGYSIIDGVVTISTERDLKRTTDTRVYDIRDLLVQVPNFTDAPAFDLSESLGGQGRGGSGGGGGSSESIFGDEEQDEGEEGVPTRAELVAEITSLIQDTIGTPEEWFPGTGGSSMRELNGNLIVKTTPTNHQQIMDLLRQLREAQSVQISVEARFLLVDQNFLEEVGIDLDVQIDDPGGNFGPIRIAQDSVNLARRVGTELTPDRFIPADDDSAGPGTFLPGTGFFPSTNRSLDVGVSYLDDLQVNLLVRATQAHQEAISVTAPRVTFYNGQRAYVLIAREIAFISDLEPVPDALAFDVELGYVVSGVKLDVEGITSADRRYVTLTLRPSLATVVQPIRQIEFAAFFDDNNDDDDDDGGNDGDIVVGLIEAPELEITEVKATVSVPDKGTLLLGGQRLVAETEIEAGVPVLSKLPFINRLFTNTSTVKDERTLLILVKPTIIIQGEEEDLLFPDLRQNPEAYNIGQASF